MAIQVNLDNQTFWAPRPLSRSRCIEGQSHSRPAVPKSSPLLSNDNRGLIGVPKESLASSPRLASSRDDVIYISDDAASDMSDASHEPFDETLPSVQAIVRSLEDAGKFGRTVGDCDQTSQHKGEHEAAPRLASSTSFEHRETDERPRPSLEVAECPTGDSASTSRQRTSMPTSEFARSRTTSPSCESSLWDAASPQTRCTSITANDECLKQTSTSEMPRRVNSLLHSLSSISQPQPMPSPDHDRTRDGMTAEESSGPSQSLPSSTYDVIHVSNDTASDRADASFHESCATLPPSVQTVVQSMEETENIGTTTHACDQTSKYENKREATPRSTLPTPVETQANQSAGLSSAELAGCSTVVSPLTPRNTASMATPGPAISQVVGPLPGGRSEDPVSMQMSRASMLAARERPVETGTETCTETTLPEASVCEPKAFERTDGKTKTTKPLSSRMHSQLQNKRLREPSAKHDTEQREVEEGSPRASDDLEYCPSTCDELETDSDRHFNDKNQPPRKRCKSRFASAKTESQIQEIVQHESAGLDQVSQLISASDDAHNMGEPINAAFDEWILQDVLLRRTIMGGKATFQFQFDWDLCMKHSAETGREGSMKQGRGKPIVKSNKRSCCKSRDETKGRRCRRCGQPGHNSRTCQNSEEPSDDEEE